MRWCESKRNYSLFDQINSYLLHFENENTDWNLIWLTVDILVWFANISPLTLCAVCTYGDFLDNATWIYETNYVTNYVIMFFLNLFIYYFYNLKKFFFAYFLEYIKYMYVYVCTRFSLSSRNKWSLDLSSLWITFKYLGNVTKSKLR